MNVRYIVDNYPDGLVRDIESVEARKVGEREKLVIYLEGESKGLALNQENLARMLEIMEGEDDTDQWIGTKVAVTVDPDVRYMGRKVGGLVVSAAMPETGKRAKK